MATLVGLLEFCVFVAVVIGLAAAVSWLVVKLSPRPDSSKRSEQTPPAG